jgi:lipopolysaccharide/colanic/teichoic acid biosynthesis glycosyltransferase
VIGYDVTKRALDVLGATVGLTLSAPLLAASAVAVRLEDRGPVFFRQERVGQDGRLFEVLKLRTMVVNAHTQGAGYAVDKGDSRITRVGSLLRKTSLDELPQLWNVLRGEMSLVGPRPFVLHEADQMHGGIGRKRLDVTPGITGLWQVLGRNDIPYDEMLKLDYLYVTGWSAWWDFQILCKTVPAVLGGKGAS